MDLVENGFSRKWIRQKNGFGRKMYSPEIMDLPEKMDSPEKMIWQKNGFSRKWIRQKNGFT